MAGGRGEHPGRSERHCGKRSLGHANSLGVISVARRCGAQSIVDRADAPVAVVGVLIETILLPVPAGRIVGRCDFLSIARDAVVGVVDRPPAHHDKTVMNGAQLLIAHCDSSEPMTGPPACQ